MTKLLPRCSLMNETKRILIVEDEGIIATDLRAKLKRLGYTVVAMVSSGEETLQRVGELKPDLILMDLGLKGAWDGIETAMRVHAQTDTPIVYLTAHADEATLQRARATKPKAYLLKPFDLNELRAVLEKALGLSPELQE